MLEKIKNNIFLNDLYIKISKIINRIKELAVKGFAYGKTIGYIWLICIVIISFLLLLFWLTSCFLFGVCII